MANMTLSYMQYKIGIKKLNFEKTPTLASIIYHIVSHMLNWIYFKVPFYCVLCDFFHMAQHPFIKKLKDFENDKITL